ncbi:hypothetical protein NS14008_14965 [Nocardia seriolae]|nr:hypothetical protein NS14008_14965 [Nocardia seriolae]PSK29419.1 CBS domain-containing protein [Nocardia seriolae]
MSMRHKTIADVMTREVVAVRADTPLPEIVRILAAHRISGAPVLDADGRVVGVVSESDLLRSRARAGRANRSSRWTRLLRKAVRPGQAARTAAELMSAPAVTVSPNAGLAMAAATLARHGVNRAPVIGDDGVLAGIVSRKDLLSVYGRPDAEMADEIRREVLEKGMWLTRSDATVVVREGIATLRGTVEGQGTVDVITALTGAVDGVIDVHNEITADTARGIMHDGVETISESASVAQAAVRMRDSDIGALPVVDAFGDAVGMVTDRDLLVGCLAVGADPHHTRVGSIMTAHLRTVPSGGNIAEALNIMREYRVRRLPVSENNRLIGIITEADLARHLPASAVGRLVGEICMRAGDQPFPPTTTGSAVSSDRGRPWRQPNEEFQP